ncbi:MAG: hypothetical protein RBT65_18715 [Methanolobus sp.]|nr:hypothetical protein [Methanolobus sp.]
MEKIDFNELLAMMAIIYKKLDELEREVKNKGWRSASLQTYLDELREKAQQVDIT